MPTRLARIMQVVTTVIVDAGGLDKAELLEMQQDRTGPLLPVSRHLIHLKLRAFNPPD